MRVYFGIGLLSASIIAYQIVLMQVLSLVQWDHFAYMILSVAMLGFGFAGTILAMYRVQLLAKSRIILPWLTMVTALMQLLSIGLSQWEELRFDSFLLFADGSHLWRLLVNYLLFMAPMATGALVIGLLIAERSKSVGKIYAANMVGSGAGAVLALLISDQILPHELPRVVAFLSLFAAGGFLSNLDSKGRLRTGVVGVLASLIIVVFPIDLTPSQFKDIAKTLTLPDGKIVLEAPSKDGLIQVVSSKHLKYEPALSLGHPGTLDVTHAVFENGNRKGPLYKPPSNQNFDHSLFHLPWVVGEFKNVLFVDAGTAPMLVPSLENGASNVLVVESNSKLTQILKGELSSLNGKVLNRPEVRVFQGNARVFYEVSPELFNLALLPPMNQLGGNAGINALAPNFTLTREGLIGLSRRLGQDGIISINCWMDYPPRYPLRVLRTLVEFLGSQGLKPPEEHLIAIRNWGAIAFVMRLTPFSDVEVEKVNQFCEENDFDPVILAGNLIDTSAINNQLQDDILTESTIAILKEPQAAWIGEYAFNTDPTSDDRPFFNQFVRLKNLTDLYFSVATDRIAFLEIGYGLVFLSLVQVSFIAILLVIIPMLFRRVGLINKSWTLLYFIGIGLGFMVLEMALIHKVSFFLGNPVTASGITIGAILVWSGVGSYWSQRIVSREGWIKSLSLILILIAGYGFFLSRILTAWLSYPEITKLILVVFSLAPLGIAIGFPFATGVFFLSRKEPAAIPWAWGVNSCFSVLAPVMATVLAIELGYQALFLAAGLAYLLPFAALVIIHPNSNPS